MGYLHIKNLYADQTILMFKECYVLEKCHGTSSHINFQYGVNGEVQIRFFSGGTKYDTFVKMFDQEKLKESFIKLGILDRPITIFGESYGGKEQGMSHTYGVIGKFVAFDVKIGDAWLDVPKAEKIVNDFGLEFVYYAKSSTDTKQLDAHRDAPSVQAIRNGVSKSFDIDTLIDCDGVVEVSKILNCKVLNPKIREGIVIRPLVELTMNNGERVICKHKRDEYRETKSLRPVVDPDKLKVLSDADDVANEWVVLERLKHVLDKIPNHCMEKMRDIIFAMTEDVLREGKGEIVESETVKKAIGKKTAVMYKQYLNSKIVNS